MTTHISDSSDFPRDWTYLFVILWATEFQSDAQMVVRKGVAQPVLLMSVVVTAHTTCHWQCWRRLFPHHTHPAWLEQPLSLFFKEHFLSLPLLEEGYLSRCKALGVGGVQSPGQCLAMHMQLSCLILKPNLIGIADDTANNNLTADGNNSSLP